MHDFARDDDNAAIIGRKILRYFCFDDEGNFNHYLAAVQLAIAFLNDSMLGPDPGDMQKQCYKDLHTILTDSKPTDNQLDEWVTANYK